MESFVIHRLAEEHYHVLLITNKGRIILRGNDCSNLPECENLIDSIRTHAKDYSKYELMTADDGKYFFRVKGAGGAEIARSEIFDDTAERYAGIGLVRRTIPCAVVNDHSFAV
jgi:uncharacterized protein YegP (UPF0339 family)